MQTNKENITQEIVQKLKNALLDGDFELAPKVTEEGLKSGVAPRVIMEQGISDGIMELEDKLFHGYRAWGHPILYMAVEGARQSLLLLEPHFKMSQEEALGTVVLGTPEGDVHDMGGKMVALNLMAAGFHVVYLGRDVASSMFVHKVQECGAQILGISSYQANSFEKIAEILDLLDKVNLKGKLMVMAGGCAITQRFTDKLGLQYGKTASEAVKLAKQYIGGK